MRVSRTSVTFIPGRKTAINQLADLGITKGTTATTFLA